MAGSGKHHDQFQVTQTDNYRMITLEPCSGGAERRTSCIKVSRVVATEQHVAALPGGGALTESRPCGSQRLETFFSPWHDVNFRAVRPMRFTCTHWHMKGAAMENHTGGTDAVRAWHKCKRADSAYPSASDRVGARCVGTSRALQTAIGRTGRWSRYICRRGVSTVRPFLQSTMRTPPWSSSFIFAFNDIAHLAGRVDVLGACLTFSPPTGLQQKAFRRALACPRAMLWAPEEVEECLRSLLVTSQML